MALVENIQREDLNPLEVALSYKRLMDDCGLTQQELGKRVGKARSSVTNHLRVPWTCPCASSTCCGKAVGAGTRQSLGGLVWERRVVPTSGAG